MQEDYGDIHLHSSEYPDFPSAYEGKCRYNALNHNLYDKYTPQPEMPLGMNRCHVEYCHPGSWQSICNNVKQYKAANDNDDCPTGVFGDEPIGKYDNYVQGPSQTGQAFMMAKAHAHAKAKAEAEAGDAENYWNAFRIVLWLFVLAVAFILIRRVVVSRS